MSATTFFSSQSSSRPIATTNINLFMITTKVDQKHLKENSSLTFPAIPRTVPYKHFLALQTLSIKTLEILSISSLQVQLVSIKTLETLSISPLQTLSIKTLEYRDGIFTESHIEGTNTVDAWTGANTADAWMKFVVVSIITLETVVRFMVAPLKRAFFMQLCCMWDILAVAPFWLNDVLMLSKSFQPASFLSLFASLFWLLKLCRYSFFSTND